MSTLQKVGDLVLSIGDDLRNVVEKVCKSKRNQQFFDPLLTVQQAMPADKWVSIKEQIAELEKAIQVFQGADSLSFRGKLAEVKDNICEIDQALNDPAQILDIGTLKEKLKNMANCHKDILESVIKQCCGSDEGNYDFLLKMWYKFDGEIQAAIDQLHFEGKVMGKRSWEVEMPCEKLKSAEEILVMVEQMILSPDFRGNAEVLSKVREVRNHLSALQNDAMNLHDETAEILRSGLEQIRTLNIEIMKGWARDNGNDRVQAPEKQESDYSKDLHEAREAIRRLPGTNEPYRTDIDATLKEIMCCFEGEAYIAVMCLCGRVLEAVLKMRSKQVPSVDVDAAIKKEYGDANTRSGKDKGKAWTLDDMTIGQIGHLIDNHFSKVVKLPPALEHTIETIAIYRNSNVHARAAGISRFPNKKSAGMIIAAIISLLDQSCVAISENPQKG